MTRRIMHTQQVCILHRLTSILEPVTGQELSKLNAVYFRVKPCFWMLGPAQPSQCHVVE